MHGGAFGRELAKARVEELIREAEVERLTGQIRAGRAAGRRARARAIGSAMLSVLRALVRWPRVRPPIGLPQSVSAASVDPVEVSTGEVAVRVTPPVAEAEARPGAAATGSTAILD